MKTETLPDFAISLSSRLSFHGSTSSHHMHSFSQQRHSCLTVCDPRVSVFHSLRIRHAFKLMQVRNDVHTQKKKSGRKEWERGRNESPDLMQRQWQQERTVRRQSTPTVHSFAGRSFFSCCRSSDPCSQAINIAFFSMMQALPGSDQPEKEISYLQKIMRREK